MRPFLRILLISALTLIGLVLAYVALFARFTPAESSSGSSAAGSISAPRTFYTSAYFGGIGGGARWPKPPAGPHALRGRILLDSKPAAGVELELALNGRFNTGRVTSDANGDFASASARRHVDSEQHQRARLARATKESRPEIVLGARAARWPITLAIFQRRAE